MKCTVQSAVVREGNRPSLVWGSRLPQVCSVAYLPRVYCFSEVPTLCKPPRCVTSRDAIVIGLLSLSTCTVWNCWQLELSCGICEPTKCSSSLWT